MKIGDYVRSSWGTISKIIEYTPYEDDECFGITLEDETNTFYKHQWQFDNDYKVSSNIIDLIEVGDYVNGCLIVEISEDPFIKGQINLWTNMIISVGEPFPNEYYKAKILEKDIKSIVTKEQFSQMEYRTGE